MQKYFNNYTFPVFSCSSLVDYEWWFNNYFSHVSSLIWVHWVKMVDENVKCIVDFSIVLSVFRDIYFSLLIHYP